MAKKYFVFSTLTAGQDYTLYAPNPSGVNVVKATVSIKGGANLANKNLVTSIGAVTEITDEQYDVLKQIDDFNLHVKNGFIRVEESRATVEAVVPDMTQRDESAPLTPADYQDGDGQAAPVVFDDEENDKE